MGVHSDVPVNALKDADVVGIGLTEGQIPSRVTCDARSTSVPPMLRVLGLLGSSQVPALLLVHLGPVLQLALLTTVGHHVAPSALSQGFRIRWLVPLKNVTVCTARHFGYLKTGQLLSLGMYSSADGEVETLSSGDGLLS